jgi:hypothetical protein
MIPDLYQYGAYSRAFLERASRHLRDFDTNGSVESFFYAALELRFGIEARIYEYLDATLKSRGEEPTRIVEYSATKLLRRLSTNAPEAERPTQVRITSEQSRASSGFEYTPVSPALARMHGQLGELLHFKFFRNNPHWYLKTAFGDGAERSLVDYRNFLNDVVAELQYATRGTLLHHPRFTQMVEELLEDSSESDPGPG